MKAGDLVKFKKSLFSSAPSDVYIIQAVSHKWVRLYNYPNPIDTKLLEVVSESR